MKEKRKISKLILPRGRSPDDQKAGNLFAYTHVIMHDCQGWDEKKQANKQLDPSLWSITWLTRRGKAGNFAIMLTVNMEDCQKSLSDQRNVQIVGVQL